jgi:hypothetical protein
MCGEWSSPNVEKSRDCGISTNDDITNFDDLAANDDDRRE